MMKKNLKCLKTVISYKKSNLNCSSFSNKYKKIEKRGFKAVASTPPKS